MRAVPEENGHMQRLGNKEMVRKGAWVESVLIEKGRGQGINLGEYNCTGKFSF